MTKKLEVLLILREKDSRAVIETSMDAGPAVSHAMTMRTIGVDPISPILHLSSSHSLIRLSQGSPTVEQPRVHSGNTVPALGSPTATLGTLVQGCGGRSQLMSTIGEGWNSALT